MDHKGAGVSPVAIVGGSGFIGRSLLGKLTASGARVRIVGVTAPPTVGDAEWVEADVRDPVAMRNALEGAEVVYHLAAVRGAGVRTWSAYYESNVEGTRNVCDAASACGVRQLVFASSAAVYGVGDGPDETRPCRPVGMYGKSKLAAEEVMKEWVDRASDRRLAVVRPSVVFGPRNDGVGNWLIRHAVFPGFALAGRGTQRKSLAYVENLAAFLEFVRGRPERVQLFNYCDEPDLTVHDIVSAVRRAVDLEPAPSRSALRVYSAAVRNALARRLGREAGLGPRGVRKALAERRFDAGKAHGTDFVQPIDVHEALIKTAQADMGWVAIMHRAASA